MAIWDTLESKDAGKGVVFVLVVLGVIGILFMLLIAWFGGFTK